MQHFKDKFNGSKHRKTESQSEILMNLNKIFNKLICGYYDKWCPVVAENGSPPSITFGENTGWAETFPCGK